MVYQNADPTRRFASEADRVADRVREQIVSGERREGARLVERDLAAEMGVSRVPVREALKLLVKEGLAVAQPRTFTTVRRFTARDIDDLIEVRSALETLVFRLAADRRRPQDVAELDETVTEEERAARDGEVAAARAAGAAFHRGVVAAAGNALLGELYDGTDGRMRWLLNQHDDPMEMAREHRGLCAAVAAGDGEKAVALAVDHLRTSRRAALRLRGGE